MADEQTTPAEQMAADHTKDELKAAAEFAGADVGSRATKADLAEAIVGARAPTAVPVVMNNFTVRGDDDAIEGGWVDVVAGEHAGRFGSFREALEHDPATGYPTKIAVLTRDEDNLLLAVDYADVRPSKRTGGR